MKTILEVLAITAIITITQTAKAAPSNEELQAQYEKRILTEVVLNDESSVEDMTKAVMGIAKDVFGKHPDVLKAKAEELLEKMESLKPDALKGYTAKKTVTNIQESLSAQKLDEDVFLFYGCRPKHVARFMKNLVLARHISPRQMGQRSVLGEVLPDKVYRVPGKKKTTLAVISLKDIFLEIRI